MLSAGRVLVIAASSLLATALLSPLSAQDKAKETRIHVSPHMGMYFPLHAAVDEAAVAGQGLEKRQVGAIVLGGRASFRMTRKLWLETALDYSPSLTAVTDDAGTFDKVGGLFIASARALHRFGTLDPKQPSFQVAAGVAAINRFGVAWKTYSGTTDLAGVLAAGARVHVHGPVSLRMDVENFLSKVQFSDNGEKTTARLNHDMVWTFGFEIPVIGGNTP